MIEKIIYTYILIDDSAILSMIVLWILVTIPQNRGYEVLGETLTDLLAPCGKLVKGRVLCRSLLEGADIFIFIFIVIFIVMFIVIFIAMFIVMFIFMVLFMVMFMVVPVCFMVNSFASLVL